MAAAQLPRRLEGEGWEVWLDADGILWTRDHQGQHGLSAAARVAAMADVIAQGGVRGVIIDDRRPAGDHTPAAKERYRHLVQGHPALPFAMVTSDPDSARIAFEVRAMAGTDNLQVFRSLPAAKAWIRARSPGRP